MQEDFHYYATYCAAFLAGYSHEESMKICYAAQFVDCCTETYLRELNAPRAAATTQTPIELAACETNILGLQNITRIWSSFHFLPFDLYAKAEGRRKNYLNKYRLICGPMGDLVKNTVELARGRGPEAVGVAMHVLADTWAHSYFAGTPSLSVNNTNEYFFELADENGVETKKRISFMHNIILRENVNEGAYRGSLYRGDENSVMNLGHGRAGHLPDYSFMRYEYMPAWKNYETIIKDNPSEYYRAFCQMVAAMRSLKGGSETFEKDSFDCETVRPHEDRIRAIIGKRRNNACEDWKAFGEELSGSTIDDFDVARYCDEYKQAPGEEKDDTFLGRFILAALAQKSMVVSKIFNSGNPVAGVAVDFSVKGFAGMEDYKKLVVMYIKDQIS